jgi:hypothetical protein
MRALVKNLDPDALEGLRKAGADWIGRAVMNTGEAGASGKQLVSSAKLDKLLRDNRATLAALFPPETVNTLQAVNADMQRANRTWSGTANKGQSPTSKNQHGVLQKIASGHGHGRFIGTLMGFGGAEALEHVMSGGLRLHTMLLGAAGGIGVGLNSLRKRENAVRQSLFTDALLNPERARFYLERIPANGGSGPLRALTSSSRRELIAIPAQQRQADRQGYRRGGVVGGHAGGSQMSIDTDREATRLMASVRSIQRQLVMA